MTYLHYILFFLCIGSSIFAYAQSAILELDSTHQQAQIIELFTSEGCSSCPPADALLATLKSHPGLWTHIIPIAWHVDYWDKLGWKDSYAKPAHSQRQHRYQQQGILRAVYTPAFTINQKEWRGFFERRALPKQAEIKTGRLYLSLNPQNMKYSAAYKNLPSRHTSNTAELHFLLLGMNIRQQIQAGENADKVLQHDFVVLAHKQLSAANNWQGSLGDILRQAKKDYPHIREHAIVAYLTATHSSEILQAVAAPLTASTLIQ